MHVEGTLYNPLGPCYRARAGAAFTVPAVAAEVLFRRFLGDLPAGSSIPDGRQTRVLQRGRAPWSCPSGSAFAGDPRWTDYALDAEFEVLEYGDWGNTRFFVRAISLWQGYGLSLTPDVLVFGRFDGNWDRYEIFRQVNIGTPVGQRVAVRIEARGNQFKVFYNGELVIEAEDPDGVYPMGRIGLRADHDSIKVYSVTVTELRGATDTALESTGTGGPILSGRPTPPRPRVPPSVPKTKRSLVRGSAWFPPFPWSSIHRAGWRQPIPHSTFGPHDGCWFWPGPTSRRRWPVPSAFTT